MKILKRHIQRQIVSMFVEQFNFKTKYAYDLANGTRRFPEYRFSIIGSGGKICEFYGDFDSSNFLRDSYGQLLLRQGRTSLIDILIDYFEKENLWNDVENVIQSVREKT